MTTPDHFSGSISWANQEQFRLLAPLFEGFAQPRLIARARAVLAAADKDVGVARLSDGGTQWVCPKCERVTCAPSCTRNALLGALDALSEALKLDNGECPGCGEPAGEPGGGVETGKLDGGDNPIEVRCEHPIHTPAAPWAFSWDDACRRIADDPSVSITAYEVQELVRRAAPGAVETPLVDELEALLAQATPAPWHRCRLDHPKDKIGEYVQGAVDRSERDDFMFVLGKHSDGEDADVCHVGNGLRSDVNAALIVALRNAAPQLLSALKASARSAPVYVVPDAVKRAIRWRGANDPLLHSEAIERAERAIEALEAITEPPAPPSAERILTQATDAASDLLRFLDITGPDDDGLFWIRFDGLGGSSAAVSVKNEGVIGVVLDQWRARLKSAKRAVPARSGAAVVMPNSPVRHTKFGGVPMEGEPHIEWVRGFQACLAEFRRLNPAPSTASASESEEK